MIDARYSLCLIQSGVCSTPVKHANVTPYGVTGDELQLKGVQLEFKINGERYRHVFCVCSLSRDADATIATDFLTPMDAKLDLKEERLWLGKSTNLNRGPLQRGQHESRGTAARAALTVFSATHGRVKQNSCMIGYSKKLEEQRDQKGVNKPEIRILVSEPWLAKTTKLYASPLDLSTL